MTAPALLASYFTFAGDTVPLRDRGPSPRDFRARVEAAGRAGFTGFGLFFTDLEAVVARHGYAGMRAIFADNGIVHVELEALIDWFADGARGAAAAPSRELLLRGAEGLGGCLLKAAGDIHGDWPLDDMTSHFGTLCDQAAACGARVSLEMIAFSNVATLERARALVECADRVNGGLLLDIWHFVRGGVDFAGIAALPPHRVFGVELNDGAAEVQGTLFEDTVYHRRFCGMGAWDVAGFVSAVAATGYSGPYGVEVLSDAVRHMPLDELAVTAYRTSARYLITPGA